jgi:hypothetical protein
VSLALTAIGGLNILSLAHRRGHAMIMICQQVQHTPMFCAADWRERKDQFLLVGECGWVILAEALGFLHKTCSFRQSYANAVSAAESP